MISMRRRILEQMRPTRTIAATYRSHSRFSRIKLRHPNTAQPWRDRSLAQGPDRGQHPAYDAALAMELIANTCELPTSKRDLLIVLAHYRHALHSLATHVLNSEAADT